MAQEGETTITVEGTPQEDAFPVKPEETPAEEEQTQAESYEGEEDKVEKKSVFDFSTMCCSFGSKGTCAICHQPISLGQSAVTLKDESITEENSEEVESEPKSAHVDCYQNLETEKETKATKIQATYRGKQGRDVAKQHKTELEAKIAEEEAAKSKAAKSKQAASEPAAPVQKKSFAQKMKDMLSCKKADTQVVESS